MKSSLISLIIMILLVMSALLVVCNAQSGGSFQSVGGDFGRTWLNNFQAQNPAPAENVSKSNGLWSWGGAPKGRSVINGQLMNNPYYYWQSLNLSYGWLGQAYVDNKTGYPVFAFVDPYTGSPDYFYMDPKTGGPVYVNSGSAWGSDNGVSANNVPPWISNPSGYTPDASWLGTPYGPDGSDVSDVYGNPNTDTSSYYNYNSGGGTEYGGTGMY